MCILTIVHKFRIKREISILRQNRENVYASKLINNCDLQVSRFTVCHHLKKINIMYEKLKKTIPLKMKDKCERVRLARKWLIINHYFYKTSLLTKYDFLMMGLMNGVNIYVPK